MNWAVLVVPILLTAGAFSDADSGSSPLDSSASSPPSMPAVEGVDIALPYEAGSVAASAGSIWVIPHLNEVVLRVDPTTSQVVEEVALPSVVGAEIDADADTVWMSVSTPGSFAPAGVVRLDATTASRRRRTPYLPRPAGTLAAAGQPRRDIGRRSPRRRRSRRSHEAVRSATHLCERVPIGRSVSMETAAVRLRRYPVNDLRQPGRAGCGVSSPGPGAGGRDPDRDRIVRGELLRRRLQGRSDRFAVLREVRLEQLRG